MRTALVTGPTQEPVALGEFKMHCGITSNHEDPMLIGLLVASRQWIEEFIWRRLLTQTWDVFLNTWQDQDRVEPQGRLYGGLYDSFGYDWQGDFWPPYATDSWPNQKIELPNGWLQSVSFINYLDATNTQQTLDPSQYSVITGEFGFIRSAYNCTWPQVLSQEDAIQIRFVCGYGDSPATVPQPIKLAIEQLANYWLENREAVAKDAPEIVYSLLGPYSATRLV